ncbi:putative porin [Christiangramia portivictoriae]|uniref:putative porin n=1 Tax=Christiangramia portivictoriae TaxID=326069 RepID=UPI000416470A|nr:putative porin [Christiangramia portivictoriae]
MYRAFALLTLLLSFSALSQENFGQDSKSQDEKQDSIPPVDLYKIISVKNDTTHLDTTLTILKDYKFNYLRRDNFELLPFSNTGQTYNSLSYNGENEKAFPEFGARARHFNFMEVDDINYYEVPTPWTQLYFKTVPEQGQQLDALFTINTYRNLNMFISYKGTRALGKYQNILTSTGNLRMGFSYHTNSDKYRIKAHFVSQDLLNEENGGLDSLAVLQYIAEEEEFDDRSVLDVKYEDAESTLFGKRLFIDHEYQITNPRDSTNSLTISHIFDYSYKKFVFNQESAENELYGNSFEATNLQTSTRLYTTFNEAAVNFKNDLLGKLSVKAGHTNYDYGYNAVYITEESIVGNKLFGNLLHLGASYEERIGDFDLKAAGRLNLDDVFSGNFLNLSAGYQFDDRNSIRFGFDQNSSLPNFNFLLYQNDYINYNWQNDFDNVSSQRLYASISSEKYANINFSLSQIDNYTYFAENEMGSVKPFQYDQPVRHLKLRAEKEFDFGLFGSYNTVMYQNVLEGAGVLNVPDLITRNSLYYKDFWFDKALYLQTGFTFKYFTKYEANAYDPILAEFYVQNEQEIGGFPIVDYFFNAKVDKARIFFKLEHLNSLVTGNNNFAAPDYPYTDFLVRFGLVWDLFL